MPKLQTATLSNQNISSALAVGTFTAAREYSSLMIRVFAEQLAGNGDYKIHLTHQIGGAGSAYKSAVTTESLASGETAHVFGSILIPVNSGDVIVVYLQGLAGDTTTPDITCEFWDLGYLRPTVTGRTLGVDADGKVAVTGLNAALLDVAVSTCRDAGAGSVEYTHTVTDSLNPLDGVDVWVSTDVAGVNVVARGSTDALGHVTFMLDPGGYYVWCQLAGFTFDNPDSVTVSA